jgi:hypothetical protein
MHCGLKHIITLKHANQQLPKHIGLFFFGVLEHGIIRHDICGKDFEI